VKFNKIKLRKTTPGVDNFLPTETAETYMLFSNYRSKNKFLVFIPSYNWTCDELILKVFHKQLKCFDQNIFSTKLCGYLLLQVDEMKFINNLQHFSPFSYSVRHVEQFHRAMLFSLCTSIKSTVFLHAYFELILG